MYRDTQLPWSLSDARARGYSAFGGPRKRLVQDAYFRTRNAIDVGSSPSGWETDSWLFCNSFLSVKTAPIIINIVVDPLASFFPPVVEIPHGLVNIWFKSFFLAHICYVCYILLFGDLIVVEHLRVFVKLSNLFSITDCHWLSKHLSSLLQKS